MSSRIRKWIGVAACATILTATAVQAQDAPARQRNRVMRPYSTERIAQRQHMAARQAVVALSRRLELDERQVTLRVAAEGADDQAGAGWRIAALLQRELTNEQKELLFEQAERSAVFQAGARFGRGQQAGRTAGIHAGTRFGRGQQVSDRNDRNQAAGLRAMGHQAGQPGTPGTGQAMRQRADSMADALGLTESQRELMRIHRAIGVAAVAHMTAQTGYRDRISSR